jgi:hypothetical protein
MPQNSCAHCLRRRRINGAMRCEEQRSKWGTVLQRGAIVARHFAGSILNEAHDDTADAALCLAPLSTGGGISTVTILGLLH